MKKIIYVLMLFVCANIALAGLVSGGVMDATLISQEPDPAGPGEFVELRWKIENMGEKIENIEFRILPEYPFSLLPGDDGMRDVGNLYGRQQGENAIIVYYKLKIDEKAVEGTSDIRLQYKTKNAPGWNTLGPYDVRIQTDDAIVSVVSVKSDPEIIEPGKKSKIIVELKNEADSLIKNVKVKWTPLTITSGTTSIVELPFTPVGSTNEKTLATLNPKASENVEFGFVVSPDAESKDYKIQLLISYIDELGNEFEIDNVMGLIVGNSPEISIALDNSEIVQKGQKGEVSVRFVNKDVMDIKFVNVNLHEKDCYTILSSSEEYLGNIDSDDFETANFDLYMEDECPLSISVSYKDSNNNAYEQKVEIPVKLYNDEEAISFGLKQKQSIVGPLVTLLVVIVGLVWYWRRRKKLKNDY